MNTTSKKKSFLNFIKKNIKLIIALLFIIGCLILLTISYYEKVNLNKLLVETEVIYLKEKMKSQKLDSIINKQNKKIITQESLITNNQKVINTISNEVFDLKKKDTKNTNTIAYLKSVTKTEFDTIEIPFMDTLTIIDTLNFEEYKKNSVTVPRTASVDSPHYKIGINVTKEGVQVTQLNIPDTLHTRIVEKTNGWFKPTTIEVQSFHTNPAIKTTNQSSLLYTPKKKKQTVLKAVIGGAAFVLGVFISK